MAWRQPGDDGSCTIQGYELWRDDGALGSFVAIDLNIGASTFSYEVTGLDKSKIYRFKVVVYNEIGSSESRIVSTVVADVPATPTLAPSFDPEFTTRDSIRVVMAPITNTGGSAILSYHLQRTETGGSVFFDVAGHTGFENLNKEVQVRDLVNRKAYRFRYRVVNKVGPSEWSPESFLVPAVKPSSPPQIILTSSSDTQIEL